MREGPGETYENRTSKGIRKAYRNDMGQGEDRCGHKDIANREGSEDRDGKRKIIDMS